jgi:hypothetical protein
MIGRVPAALALGAATLSTTAMERAQRIHANDERISLDDGRAGTESLAGAAA